MKPEGRSIQIGAAVIVCALVLRLFGGGGMDQMVKALSSPEVLSVIMLLETGRIVRPEQIIQTEPTQPEASLPPETEVTEPEQTIPRVTAQAVFAPDDTELVEVNSVCGYETDLSTWLKQPLKWDLTADTPTVLILHTHGTESYTKTEDYQESSQYRTLDVGHNVVSIGDRLVQVLQTGGIQVVHDRTMHDHPSYSNSYNQAREAMAAYLEKYPSIRLVLDIHRDSVEDKDGDQVRFVTRVNGKDTGQLMMVVGTDAGGLTHPDWPENMSLAVKLHAQLEKNAPGICRPISFRTQRFNQDLSPGALIVEVGSAGNTRQEALLAAEQLGKAILELAAGTG